ncbi:MAG: hypothetical protein M3N19_03620 [Candidatus Eremiobacteraeota bacterium]|nr:hypothetical protein [Candidatus Eremiobacteraeota bacterium]
MLLAAAALALVSPVPSAEPATLPAIIEVARNDHQYAVRLFSDGTAILLFDGRAKNGPPLHLDLALVRRFFADADNPSTNFGEWNCESLPAFADSYTVRYGSRVATSPNCGPAGTLLSDAKRVIEVAFNELKKPA